MIHGVKASLLMTQELDKKLSKQYKLSNKNSKDLLKEHNNLENKLTSLLLMVL